MSNHRVSAGVKIPRGSGSPFSRVWLCNPMDCSMPGFTVHRQLPGPAQTPVHRVGDATPMQGSVHTPKPRVSTKTWPRKRSIVGKRKAPERGFRLHSHEAQEFLKPQDTPVLLNKLPFIRGILSGLVLLANKNILSRTYAIHQNTFQLRV